VGDYRQPWRRVEIGGRRFHLQVVDPSTAFDIEPELVAALGDTLSLFIAAPDHVIGTAMKQAAGGGTSDPALLGIVDIAPVTGNARTATAIASLGRVLADCIMSARLEPAWVRATYGRLVLGRLRIGEDYIDGARDWARLGFGPLAKWQALAAQIQQSFGPLWTRSPYKLRVPAKDYGVPEPTGVPVATRYAIELAKAGVASSMQEILDEWTPVRMIEVIEAQTYAAENERRAHEAAKSGAA
jgi:hypothetical protein